MALTLKRNLKIGLEGEDIKNLQIILNKKLNLSLKTDGIFGNETKKAVILFQEKNNLTQDGIVGKQTWNKLNLTPQEENKIEEKDFSNYTFTRNLKKGSKGEDVKSLQIILNELGFNCGEADGSFGSKTYNALVKAQNKFHLTADGIAGKKTIQAFGATWEKIINSINKDYLIICSFNIKRGTYKSGSYKIIGDIVGPADIVGIQEVTPAAIKKIGSYAGKTSNMCETISNYGHAILTNFKENDEVITTLKGSGERRKLHMLDFGDVAYYNTHFHYTESANNTQMKQLTEILSKDTHKTIIITGDFNRQEYKELRNLGFTQVNTGQMIEDEIDGSCDIVNKIDQIFVKGGRVAKVWKYGAVRKNYSDHDALFATIMI